MTGEVEKKDIDSTERITVFMHKTSLRVAVPTPVFLRGVGTATRRLTKDGTKWIPTLRCVQQHALAALFRRAE